MLCGCCLNVLSMCWFPLCFGSRWSREAPEYAKRSSPFMFLLIQCMCAMFVTPLICVFYSHWAMEAHGHVNTACLQPHKYQKINNNHINNGLIMGTSIIIIFLQIRTFSSIFCFAIAPCPNHHEATAVDTILFHTDP